MAGLTTAGIKRAVASLADRAESSAGALNAADGRLGDGDLGITVASGWREASDRAAAVSDDVGLAFLALAKAFQAASASSFGTLTATALMSAATACKGRTEVPWNEVSVLLAGARDAMTARGKGALGQKSVLDIIDALAAATEGLAAPEELMAAAVQACQRTLDRFRDKPAGLGRARMYADRSIGMDDPGMLAVEVMVSALAEG